MVNGDGAAMRGTIWAAEAGCKVIILESGGRIE
jgi:hypothetical protein